MEGIHVKRQVVQLAFVVGYRTVGIAVEGHQAVHKIPHLFIRCMEYVRAVRVHVYTGRLVAIDVATQMRAAVNDQTLLTRLFGKECEGRSEETRTYYEKIVFFHLCAPKAHKGTTNSWNTQGFIVKN